MSVSIVAILALGACTTAPPAPAPPRPDASVAPARADAVRVSPPAPEAAISRFTCELPERDVDQCFELVAGGSFVQGAQSKDPAAPAYDDLANPDEAPPRRVTLPSFRLMRQEANRRLFRECVTSGWCDAADSTESLTPADDPDEGLYAVAGLSWTGAARLCAWLGGRLPTEAEWEFAARGPEARRFPWGDDPNCGVTLDDPTLLATTCKNTGVTRNLMRPTPTGFVGMAGNVWEWTADAYAADAYAGGDAVDPRGPSQGGARVQRGGGWTSTDAFELRSSARGSLVPESHLPDVGVRCARDVTP